MSLGSGVIPAWALAPWRDASSAEEGKVYLTKIDEGNGRRNIQKLKKKGNFWFVPDGSIYVYYTPTHIKDCQ